MKLVSSKHQLVINIGIDDYILSLLTRRYMLCAQFDYCRGGLEKNRLQRILDRNDKQIRRLLTKALGNRLVSDRFGYEFKNQSRTEKNRRTLHPNWRKQRDIIYRYDWYVEVTSDLKSEKYMRPDEEVENEQV